MIQLHARAWLKIAKLRIRCCLVGSKFVPSIESGRWSVFWGMSKNISYLWFTWGVVRSPVNTFCISQRVIYSLVIRTQWKTAKSLGSCEWDKWNRKGLGWKPLWPGMRIERQRWLILSLEVSIVGWPSITGTGVSARDSAMVSNHTS